MQDRTTLAASNKDVLTGQHTLVQRIVGTEISCTSLQAAGPRIRGAHRARLVGGVHLDVDLALPERALLHGDRRAHCHALRRVVKCAAKDADDLIEAEVRMHVDRGEHAGVHLDGKRLRVVRGLTRPVRVRLELHHRVAHLADAVEAVRRLDVAPIAAAVGGVIRRDAARHGLGRAWQARRR
jgi:hypothetical protein